MGDAPSENENYGREVISQDQLAELKVRSDARGLMQLGAHLAFIIVTGSLVWHSTDTPWLVPTMFVHGVGLVFLFAPLHETIHRTAFRSRWLNDAVARFCGLVLFLGPDFFRGFHFAHHRHTNLPEHDPELEVKNVDALGGYLYYLSGMSYWIRALSGLSTAALGRVEARFIADAVKPLVVREARVMLAVYLGAVWLVVFQTPTPLLLWLGPLVLAQPLWRGWLLAEHTGCSHNDNIYANTRTINTNPCVRFGLWQMPYHVAHHAYPAIPFHALRRANELIREHSQADDGGYLAFHLAWLRSITTRRG